MFERGELTCLALYTHSSLLSHHGGLWFNNSRWYAVCLPLSRERSHFRAQFVCGHRLLGKPPNCQISSTTPPFEERARFLYQNVLQRPTPPFAKWSKLSMTASLPLIRLSQIKQRPLSSVASYLQAQDGTKTDASCSIGSFDPTRLNRKCMMQLHALCCRDYWTDSTRLCSHMG